MHMGLKGGGGGGGGGGLQPPQPLPPLDPPLCTVCYVPIGCHFPIHRIALGEVTKLEEKHLSIFAYF